MKAKKLMEPPKEVVHELKTIEPYFTQVLHGFKDFEVRKNDRNFQVGDFLKLVKYDAVTGLTLKYSPIYRRIKYILEGGQFGIEKGYCVLGLYPKGSVFNNYLETELKK